jgi:hypothetical protein
MTLLLRLCQYLYLSECVFDHCQHLHQVPEQAGLVVCWPLAEVVTTLPHKSHLATDIIWVATILENHLKDIK